MIKHIVMWKMKDAEGKTAKENAAYVKECLERLPPLIPELLRLEVHLDSSGNDGNYDLTLLTETESFQALHAYQIHPEHQKVSGYVKKVSAARSCVDYEF